MNLTLHLKLKLFFKKKVETFKTDPYLPLINSYELIKQPKMNRVNKQIDALKWLNIKEKIKEKGLTITDYLCAAYVMVLAKWSQEDFVTVNMTVYDRQIIHPDVSKIVGDFTDIILLQFSKKEINNIWDTAKTVKNKIFEEIKHRHNYSSGVKVLNEIAQYNDMIGRVIAPVVFTNLVFNFDIADNNFDISSLGEYKYGLSQTPQIILDNHLFEMNGNLFVSWDYIYDILDSEMITSMFETYVNVICDENCNELLLPKTN